jgi:hypothetical protein
MNAMASAHPDRVWAIGDPFNGPGVAFDATYAATFASFRASGGKLLGYVDTNYGQRTLAQVEADIDTGFAWYPNDGIFLDQMDNVVGAHESYYRDLTRYVRTRLATAVVIANPGTSTSPSYVALGGEPVVSAVCIYENSTNFQAWTPDAWVATSDRRNFVALAYKVAANAWQADVDHAFASNCGWIEVTDDDLPNPWDTLPPWFESLVAYVDSTY